MALRDKQAAFVNEYLLCWNASEAARRAGYSEKTAGSIGHENLKKPEIAEEIQRRIDEQVMTPGEVLTRFSEQARAEYSRYMMPNGTVDLARLIADGKAHLIKSVKTTQWGVNVEFYDAHAAKELIGKHHGLFATKVEHGGSIDLNMVKGFVKVSPDDWDKDDTLTEQGTTHSDL